MNFGKRHKKVKYHPNVKQLPAETREKWELYNKGGSTSDIELTEWAHANIPNFKGVVAREDFDVLYPYGEPMEPGTSCIINLDYGDYARGGTHWCAVRVSSETPRVLYFDPFGIPPPSDVMIRSFKDHRGVFYPDIQYQEADQTNCGQRCLAALYYLNEEASKNEETSAFDQLGLDELNSL